MKNKLFYFVLVMLNAVSITPPSLSLCLSVSGQLPDDCSYQVCRPAYVWWIAKPFILLAIYKNETFVA